MRKSLFEVRLRDIRRFYELLDRLEANLGGKRSLSNADGRMDWPKRGVYFFFEPGERRTTTGSGLRVVRVGTHALKAGSKTTLWDRLRQHRGTLGGLYPGGGNHRSSVFRKHVGTALIARDGWSGPVSTHWGRDSSASKAVRQAEYPLEYAVSQHIRSMPFLWLAVEDVPGPESLRGYIERNAIALLSNYLSHDEPIDPPSASWLGRHAASKNVRLSGLWNSNHVAESFAPSFLDILQQYVF